MLGDRSLSSLRISSPSGSHILVEEVRTQKGLFSEASSISRRLSFWFVLIGSLGSWKGPLTIINQVEDREGARRLGRKWIQSVQAEVVKSG